MKNQLTPERRIRELEAKLKRLESEKEILNRAIDIADKELKTDIRKKCLSLLSEASDRQQGESNRVKGESRGDVTDASASA
jgi:ElaB/YqjD/DUF883 family membrane-anchored ribosome-binding protein